MRKLLLLFLALAAITTCNLTAQNSRNYSINGKEKEMFEKKFSDKTAQKASSDYKQERLDVVNYDKNVFKRPENSLKFNSGFSKKMQSQNFGNLNSKVAHKVSVEKRKSAKEDVATVILRVIGDPVGDGSGFQMLLDADHIVFEKYDNGEYNYDNLAEEFYADCEYKIPKNACPDFNNPGIIIDGEGYVEIPEGIYDFNFFIPDPIYETYWFVDCINLSDYAIVDDYIFRAGYEYVFKVVAEEYGVKLEPQIDAFLSEIILPPVSSSLTNSENIKISLINNGKLELTNINLCYKINDETTVTETFTEVLTSGNEIIYTFDTKADFSHGGIYKVKAWVDFELDMIPSNNYVLDFTQNKSPIQLPFISSFEEEYYMNLWTVVDANKDEYTWGIGYRSIQVFCPYFGDDEIPYPADDYVISSDPIIMTEKGTYNISFHASNWGETESIRILYGTSPNYEKMNVLVDYPSLDTNNEIRIYFHNFEIETPGNYYFAFHYYSNRENNSNGISLYDVTISGGQFVGIPDISIKQALIPLLFCDLQTGFVIDTEIYNGGSDAAHEFTLTYQVNEETPVTQTFTQKIELYESVKVYFDQTVDLLAYGDLKIKISASTPSEVNVANNEIEIDSKVFAPVTTLPFESNFQHISDRADWSPEIPKGWMFIGTYGPMIDGVPLLSRCITLDAGEYRFSYNFMSGHKMPWGIWPSDFYVTYGKSGTKPSSWIPAKEYYNCYTNDKFIDDDIIISITEPGEYVLAIFPINALVLELASTSLTDLSEHDFKIQNIEHAFSPRMIPAYQLEGENKFTAVLQNRGKVANESGIVKLLHNNNELAFQEFAFTEKEQIINVDLKPILGTFSPNSTTNIEIKASISNGLSKEWKILKTVSDSTFASDNIDTGFEAGIGFYVPGSLGMIYELTKTDIVTSVTVGLYEIFNGQDSYIILAAYKVNENFELGKMLFEKKYLRTIGNNAKGITFDVPDTELQPGKYYFEVRQLDDIGIAVALDFDPDGYHYWYRNNELIRFSDYGSIHLRPNFGKYGVGIEELRINNGELIIYPNPAKDELRVENGELKMEKINIYNAVGQIMMEVSNINSTSYRLNVEKFNSGLYFISVQTANGVVNEKFVVK